jgi:ribosomal protein S18 acetylase RimI-like enzyme
MKLSDTEKMEQEPRLWEITAACYTGVQLPARLDFGRFLKHGDVFVIYNCNDYGDYGELVSYALVTPGWGDDATPLIRSIATEPKSRGNGHAMSLLTEIAGFYRVQDIRQIILHCKSDNPAQTLYFKAGYRVTAILRNYYRPEGDGLEMRKIL